MTEPDQYRRTLPQPVAKSPTNLFGIHASQLDPGRPLGGLKAGIQLAAP